MTAQSVSRRGLLAGAIGVAFTSSGVIDPSHADAAMSVAIPGVRGIVTSPDGYLNLRSGPGIGYSVIARLYNGQVLAISHTSGDWFKVSASGRIGWVNSLYVLLTGIKSTEVRRGNPNRKQIALTFDCGSDFGYADTILTTLAKFGVPASFGLTGTWMNQFPGTVARISNGGHQLLNHTLNHPSFTGISTPGTGPRSPAKRLSQIQANEELIRSLTGQPAKPFWRPPYGDIDASVLRDVGALGFTMTVMWTIDSLGWNGLTANDIYWRVMDRTVWGAIVLMHVGSQSQDAGALDRLIRNLSGSGYSFGTVVQIAA